MATINTQSYRVNKTVQSGLGALLGLGLAFSQTGAYGTGYAADLLHPDTPVGVDSFSPDAKPVFSFDPVGRDNVGRPIRNYVTPPLVTGAETDAEFVFVRDHLLAGLPVVGGLVGAGLGLPLGLLGPVGSSLFPGLSLGSLGGLIGGYIGVGSGFVGSLGANSILYGASLASTGAGALIGSLATTVLTGAFSLIGAGALGVIGSILGGVYGSMAATPSLFVPASSFGSASSFGGGLSSAALGASVGSSLGAGLTGSLPSLGAGLGAWAASFTSLAVPIIDFGFSLALPLGSTSLGAASGYVPASVAGFASSPSLGLAGSAVGGLAGLTGGLASSLVGAQAHVDNDRPKPAKVKSKKPKAPKNRKAAPKRKHH